MTAFTVTYAAAAAPVITIGAFDGGSGVNQITAVGHWQIVRNMHDGRFGGASLRSYHAGDELSLMFYGARLRIYGVTGPTGGRARISFGPSAGNRVNLNAGRKHAHVLLFDGIWPAPGYRLARVTVLAQPGTARERYVNIDEFEVDAQPPSRLK